jgi:glycosyltransferase involved in cell wall biosynthesis
MKVYLSNPYGTIPGEDWREYRFFLLAKALASEGHEVVWFTSTFSHHFKKERSIVSKIILSENNIKIHLIKSRPYRNNFSFGRIFRDLTYGINLIKTLNKEYTSPDLFFVGDSPLLFYYPSYWYCKKNNIPYIIDQMDLWPELIVDSFPQKIRPIINMFCYPIYLTRRIVFDNSFGFISLAQKYLQIPKLISKNIADRPNSVIYNGIDVDEFRKSMTIQDDEINNKLGLKPDDEIWFIFAGTLGPSYDLKTMLNGFLKFDNTKVKLIIAGDGSERYFIEKFIEDNYMSNVKYLGKISKNALPYLYSKCDVGLNIYGEYSNVEMSDKFYDYTAAGLIVINSLKGEVRNYINEYSIGYNYTASNLPSFINVLERIVEDSCLSIMKLNSFNLGSRFDQKIQISVFKNFVKAIEQKMLNSN